MMQPWDLLGLEPTRDTGAIRRAYAAAAARYNPEEHPEEFLAVRQAYEQAMAYARGQEQPDAPAEGSAPQPRPVESAGPVAQEAETGGFTLWEEAQGEGDFPCPALERFEELYRSKQRRDRKQWDLWFTSPEFLAVFHDPRFTHALWQTVDQAGEDFPPPKEFQLALAVAYRYRAEVYQAEDSETIGKWGLLRLYQKVDEALNAAQIAEQAKQTLAYYNRPLQTLKISSLGVLGLRAGMMLLVNIPGIEGAEKSYLLLEKVSHTFEQGVHTMDIETMEI